MFARSLGVVSPSVFTVVVPVTSDTTNIALDTESKNRGWNGAKRLRTFVNINNNTTVTSTTNTEPALTVNLRDNDFVRITNNGTIAGAPGSGGNGGLNGPGDSGQPGGDAIVAESPAELINNGTIGAGEGGEGGEGGINTPFSNFQGWAFAGCPQGSLNRGGGTCGVCAYTVSVRVGKGYRNETRFVNANCRAVYSNGVTTARGRNGNSGQRGNAKRGNSGPSRTFTGGSGGPPGKTIRKGNLLRLVNNGTINGEIEE